MWYAYIRIFQFSLEEEKERKEDIIVTSYDILKLNRSDQYNNKLGLFHVMRNTILHVCHIYKPKKQRILIREMQQYLI